MEKHQIYPDGTINTDTGVSFPVLILVDTSGTMGEYNPQIVENAINSFFMRIGKYKIIDKFVDVCIYESHDEFEYLAGFGKASNYVIRGIRYGGNWNLSEDFAKAIEIVQETIQIYQRTGKPYAGSLVIILSDNQVSDNVEDYIPLDDSRYNTLSPTRTLFISSKENNFFVESFDNMELKCVKKEDLQKCMIEIADEIIDVVRLANSMD